MCDYFSYTTADIVFIDDECNDTDGQNAAKQKSDGEADDKETATDEKTKERSDDQVITGNKTDSKENATDNETEDDDAGEQGNITVTREHDEHQHTSNEGDEEHVQWSRMTSMHHDKGQTEGRCDKEFMCYLIWEKFYNKSGVRTHYLHAHDMSLDVQEIANDGWPHFMHAIYDDDDESNVVVDYGDVNPWTETLNDKKTKVQVGARGRGRGRGRERGRGRGRGKGRGQFEDVVPHSWQSLDWRAEINSTEGARSRCENYKEILDDMSKSETPEDRSMCELLKIVTATCEENLEEKSEQSEILIGDISQYLDDDDYSDEPDLAQWDDIKLQPLNTEEKRCDVGDESNIEDMGLKGDESSVEEIELKDDESSIEEVELQGDGSSIAVIDIESDESCTEMAAMKTDKDNLNDAQYESDESTIKRNKQRLLKIKLQC